MLLGGFAAGCASTEPVAYSGLASAAQLRPDPNDRSGRKPYGYESEVDWSTYRKIIIPPVGIYGGPDSQFGKMPDADKRLLAAYMQSEFMSAAATRFAITTIPAPDVLRVEITLTGAKATTPVLGTASRFDIMGGAYNTVQAVRQKEGALTGSVSYAVEIYDAASNRLLKAYVAKQYPNAMNVGASLKPLDAAKVGIRKAADDFVAQIREGPSMAAG
ncbi:DUF3313 domain-containing protein [Agrobacterium sp. a22-2]|nr:DUF3313 domain-containing protein [Agrobacterium sp. a22-2]NKN36481.1 DUF3313 domain-containing protein [Agrobacterium sp. a22-2]